MAEPATKDDLARLEGLVATLDRRVDELEAAQKRGDSERREEFRQATDGLVAHMERVEAARAEATKLADVERRRAQEAHAERFDAMGAQLAADHDAIAELLALHRNATAAKAAAKAKDAEARANDLVRWDHATAKLERVVRVAVLGLPILTLIASWLWHVASPLAAALWNRFWLVLGG